MRLSYDLREPLTIRRYNLQGAVHELTCVILVGCREVLQKGKDSRNTEDRGTANKAFLSRLLSTFRPLHWSILRDDDFSSLH